MRQFPSWQSIKYLLQNDQQHLFLRFFLKNFFSLSFFLRKKTTMMENFSLYGLLSKEEFEKKLLDPKTLLFIGISYCQKPTDCPGKKFSSCCLADQCPKICSIGQYKKQAQNSPYIRFAILPTVHDLAYTLLSLFPKRDKMLFLISSCPFSLSLFGPYASLLHMQGIGFHLKGNVCSKFASFQRAEKEVLPFVTYLPSEIEKKILEIISKKNSLSMT